LEERLLQSDTRKSEGDVGALLADAFIEFGSSGRVYNKQESIAALLGESPSQPSLADFYARELAPGVVLATYSATKGDFTPHQTVCSLRSSIWQWIDGRWQTIFHQGTLSMQQVEE